ncbi:GNAT family protein [Tabrizicola sp.]|uniref:GNAT family N-acetyltransferase n=1 Tax=Tabrizicola sp. TaxID=2005166 RepID=UPI00286C2E8E|nr:GNAT family protein [Tabrizicola sp.]
MTANAASGPPVLIDTPRFRGRSARPSDATQDIADWFSDPDRVGPLNMPPRKLAVPDLRRFLAGFDNRSRFLVALIDKQDDRLCGFYHAEFNALHRISRISFLNGPNGPQARKAMIALGYPLLDLQFRRFGMEKIVAQVLAGNLPVCRHLDRLGFQREGYLRGQVRAPGGAGRLDQVLFGLLPGDLRRAY